MSACTHYSTYVRLYILFQYHWIFTIIIIMPLETHLETPNTKYKRNRVENEGLFITCQQQGQWRLWGRYISIDVTI